VRDVKPDANVVPDPFGLIVAYQRKSVEVEQTTCQREGLQ
jgi:hypothetical protein